MLRLDHLFSNEKSLLRVYKPLITNKYWVKGMFQEEAESIAANHYLVLIKGMLKNGSRFFGNTFYKGPCFALVA
jgi:hypothetical protein